MQNKILRFTLLMFLTLPFVAKAQNSSLNTFSPYTFYGLGDLHTPATAANAGMGSLGLAMWNPYSVNLMNPAAYSAVMRKSFLFDLGGSGKSSYLKTSKASSSYNGFSMSNVAIQFPLYKGIGFAMNITPYSSVGYRVQREETDPDLRTDIGHIKYTYNGEGDISQFKSGVGLQLFKGLSVGADFIYYLGTLNRYYGEVITPIVIPENIGSITVRTTEEISKVSFGVGAQYNIISTPKQIMTLGATFQPRTKLNSKTIKEVGSSQSSDSIYKKEFRTPMDIPQKIGVGVFYRTSKLGAGIDYTLQDWSGAFHIPEEDGVTLTKRQTFNVGVSYTPNRMDIRSRMKRWTYRAGLRYSDMYLVKDGHKTNDASITLGVGVPLKFSSFSDVNVGIEFGQRGTTSYGLVKDNYFKISVGFSLFGEDQWFVKRKYY